MPEKVVRARVSERFTHTMPSHVQLSPLYLFTLDVTIVSVIFGTAIPTSFYTCYNIAEKSASFHDYSSVNLYKFDLRKLK